jgi:hypothetical protein
LTSGEVGNTYEKNFARPTFTRAKIILKSRTRQVIQIQVLMTILLEMREYPSLHQPAGIGRDRNKNGSSIDSESELSELPENLEDPSNPDQVIVPGARAPGRPEGTMQERPIRRVEENAERRKSEREGESRRSAGY